MMVTGLADCNLGQTAKPPGAVGPRRCRAIIASRLTLLIAFANADLKFDPLAQAAMIHV
ncbi:hypothetical protein J6500_02335 [Bradyrhizobium sp. WSM 1704]|uniref:hypothetical protein n=1 Tax=Bradyrhizobium semiaridum TaxID=2821404 RepID=UPI001CE23462|nr:hypothetical protein [Bradyrhizobium semiaridum]MCA6120745.1 hypothetical protein [Bradyrhizobium semiaridum]